MELVDLVVLFLAVIIAEKAQYEAGSVDSFWGNDKGCHTCCMGFSVVSLDVRWLEWLSLSLGRGYGWN